MRSHTVTLAALLFATIANAQNVSVSKNWSVYDSSAPRPGEAQSTVVPPGLKTQCMAGRFLVTNDSLRPPAYGLVTGLDLDKADGPPIRATFDNPPGQVRLRNLPGTVDTQLYPRYAFVTNDHDLVVLDNGDVLYLTGAASRARIKTPWFETSYRGSFGPGARSVLLAWRSTDCGQTFHYTGEFDPARVEDGSCAMPQFRMDARRHIIDSLPYDMGGSDGQTVRVDPTNNRLYLTFSCVGYNAKPGAKFELDRTHPLDKTLVAVSDDSGATWKSLGFIPKAVWRMPVIPVGGSALAFGINDGVLIGTRSGGGYAFDQYFETPNSSFGWPGFPLDGKNNPWMHTNMFGHNIAARSPGSTDMFIAFPTKLGNKGFGYRLAFYDRDKKAFADADDDILPVKESATNFVFHLTAVDNGHGPVLLYWTDVDFDSKSATVRGRLVFGPASYSSDFTISRLLGQPRSFKLVQKNPADWYGDYQTAAGFRHAAQGPAAGAIDTYYPMWIEPGGVIRFAAVEYAEHGTSPNVRRISMDARQWRTPTTTTTLQKVQTVTVHERD